MLERYFFNHFLEHEFNVFVSKFFGSSVLLDAESIKTNIVSFKLSEILIDFICKLHYFKPQYASTKISDHISQIILFQQLLPFLFLVIELLNCNNCHLQTFSIVATFLVEYISTYCTVMLKFGSNQM